MFRRMAQGKQQLKLKETRAWPMDMEEQPFAQK